MGKKHMAIKHQQFEKWTLNLKGATRSIENNAKGVPQHVVKSERALLRWPVNYNEGEGSPARPAQTVRFEPLEY